MAKTTRYTGYCPCCDSFFKVRSGKLVHHGYQRPGFGYIVGDCYGALETPHEISAELATEYRGVLQGMLTSREERLASIDAATELPKKVRDGFEYGHTKYKTVMVPKTVAPKGGYDWDNDREGALAAHTAVTEWESVYKSTVRALKMEIESLTADVERLTKLIETWEKKPLATREEEQVKVDMAKAERAAKKVVDRKARIDKVVESYRKRIDSAVKNKNSRTLADIWESIQRGKLRDMDRDLTREDCLALVGRAEVWAAFGLAGLTLSSYRNPGPDDKILALMKERMDRFEFSGYYTGKDDWERNRLTAMSYEWPEALGGENKKGLKTLAEVRKILNGAK